LFRELDIAVRPSAYLTAILAIAHVGALGCVLLLPLDWVFRAILAVPVVLGLLVHIRAVTPVHYRVVTRCRWAADGSWTLWEESGGPWAVEGRALLVHPWMTILGFHCQGERPWSVVILPDSADPELRRRLNVRLRMARPQGGSD